MARSTSQAEKLRKLENLMNNKAATAGEKAAAKSAWERIAGKTYTARSSNSSARSSMGGSRSGATYKPKNAYDYAARSAAASARSRAQRDAEYAREAWKAAGRAWQNPDNRKFVRSLIRDEAIALGVPLAIGAGTLIYLNRDKIKKKINDIRNKFKGGRGASNAQAA